MKKMKIFSKKKTEDWVGYLIIAPAYSVYFLFVFTPLVIAIYYSFTNYDFYKTKDFVGLTNYIVLFKDKQFGQAVVNTLWYSLFTIIPIIVFGLILAILVNKKLIGKNIYRASIYLPNVVSMVAVSMIWLFIFDPTSGILNYILRNIGLQPKQWLFDTKTAMPSLIVMGIWRGIGYSVITYLAGLQGIPGDLYEAATVDGASPFQQMIKITIPMLRPTTFFIFVITTIASFNVFEQVNIMTNGGPINSTTTIVHQVYINAFRDFRMGYASAMAVILFLVTLIFTLLFFKFGNQDNGMEG